MVARIQVCLFLCLLMSVIACGGVAGPSGKETKAPPKPNSDEATVNTDAGSAEPISTKATFEDAIESWLNSIEQSGFTRPVLDMNEARSGDFGFIEQAVTIVNVLGDGLLMRTDENTLFKLEGSFTGVSDDRLDISKHFFHVVGRFQYNTVIGGQKTVRKIESPYGINEEIEARKNRYVVALAEQEAERREAKIKADKLAAEQDEAQRLSEIREWKSTDGKFTIQARFKTQKPGGIIVLEKEDSTTIDVPKIKLSENDLSYIEQVKKTGIR